MTKQHKQQKLMQQLLQTINELVIEKSAALHKMKPAKD